MSYRSQLKRGCQQQTIISAASLASVCHLLNCRKGMNSSCEPHDRADDVHCMLHAVLTRVVEG